MASEKSEPVSIETTLSRLCAAVVSLKKKEAAFLALFETAFDGAEGPSFEEINVLQYAILDLCGVPKENLEEMDPEEVGDDPEYCCRDFWTTELDEILTADSTEKDFDEVPRRIREISRMADEVEGGNGRLVLSADRRIVHLKNVVDPS